MSKNLEGGELSPQDGGRGETTVALSSDGEVIVYVNLCNNIGGELHCHKLKQSSTTYYFYGRYLDKTGHDFVQPSPTTIMGLPQTTAPPSSSIPASEKPTSVSQLPPEAIQLATKLFNLARAGDTPALSQYLSAGIPANLTNHKGDTLLMLAAYHGNIETVRVLIEKGADVDAINDRGQSPIAGAVFKGYDEVVRVLVEEGKADVMAGQPNAVEAAYMFKREGCLRILGLDEASGSDAQ
jgi:hypothetical protein